VRAAERRGVGRAHKVAVPGEDVLDLDAVGLELARGKDVVGGYEVVQRTAAVRMPRRILVGSGEHRDGEEEEYESDRGESIHGLPSCREGQVFSFQFLFGVDESISANKN